MKRSFDLIEITLFFHVFFFFVTNHVWKGFVSYASIPTDVRDYMWLSFSLEPALCCVLRKNDLTFRRLRKDLRMEINPFLRAGRSSNMRAKGCISIVNVSRLQRRQKTWFVHARLPSISSYIWIILEMFDSSDCSISYIRRYYHNKKKRRTFFQNTHPLPRSDELKIFSKHNNTVCIIDSYLSNEPFSYISSLIKMRIASIQTDFGDQNLTAANAIASGFHRHRLLNEKPIYQVSQKSFLFLCMFVASFLCVRRRKAASFLCIQSPSSGEELRDLYTFRYTKADVEMETSNHPWAALDREGAPARLFSPRISRSHSDRSPCLRNWRRIAATAFTEFGCLDQPEYREVIANGRKGWSFEMKVSQHHYFGLFFVEYSILTCN